MTDFLLLSEGGSMPETEEEQKAIMDAWMSWYGKLGAAVKDPGNPMSATKSVASDGTVSDGGGSANGYIIVTAESLDAAVSMARDCPALMSGSRITVYETVPMT